LAHEIKNPLTPIQLSAERVQWKLTDKLEKKDADLLAHATHTIIQQVAALKEMVEGFRNYARKVSLNLELIDFNDLLKEVLHLYEGMDCTFTTNLSKMSLPVRVDATSVRQVLHNLLKNATEAAQESIHPEINIRTWVKQDKVMVQIENNGKGFSAHMLQHAFEPYITDKAEGTGLGLAVVKKIIDEHGGRVHLANCADGEGARVTLILSLVHR
jgi:sensor histidine kinase